MRAKIAVFVFLIFILAYAVKGVGIGGQDVAPQVFFIPGKEIEFQFYLLTTSDKTMDYEIYAMAEEEFFGKPQTKYDFSKHISFEPKVLASVPPHSKIPFKIRISFPQSIDSFGLHTVYLCVRETQGSKGMLGSKSAACARLGIIAVYPGKVLKATISATDASLGELVKFELLLENWGNQEIESAQSRVSVYNVNNSQVASMMLDPVSIPPRGSKTLISFLDTIGLSAGTYSAIATVDWDGNSTNAIAEFKIGTLDIKLINYSKRFEQKLAPFNVVVESRWGGHIPTIFAKIEVCGKSLLSPTLWLKPWQRLTLTAYLDASDIEPGTCKGTLTIYFGNRTKEYPIKIEILPKPTQQFPSPKMGKTLIILIAMLVICIAITNAILFKLLKRRKR